MNGTETPAREAPIKTGPRDEGPLNEVKAQLNEELGDEQELEKTLNTLMGLLVKQVKKRVEDAGKPMNDKDMIAAIRAVQGSISLRLAGRVRDKFGEHIPIEEMIRRLDQGAS